MTNQSMFLLKRVALAVAIAAVRVSQAHADSVNIHLKTQDGRPLAGFTVTMTMGAQVVASEVTNAVGECTLTDNVFAGALRCVQVIANPTWNFTACTSDQPTHPSCLTYPTCANSHNNDYFYFGTQGALKGKRGQAIGGAHGYVNPNAGEQATLVFTPDDNGEVKISIYTMRGKLVMTRTVAAKGGVQNSTKWDGRASDGQIVASGIYAVRITGQGLNENFKLAIVRK
jgi:hypothetical protein